MTTATMTAAITRETFLKLRHRMFLLPRSSAQASSAPVAREVEGALAPAEREIEGELVRDLPGASVQATMAPVAPESYPKNDLDDYAVNGIINASTLTNYVATRLDCSWDEAEDALIEMFGDPANGDIPTKLPYNMHLAERIKMLIDAG